MNKTLELSEVYFGLIRVGFKHLGERVCKWSFLHWAGDDANAKKLRAGEEVKEDVADMLAPYHLELSATSMEDVAARTSALRIAGVLAADTRDEDMYSFDTFLHALTEEREAFAKMFASEIDLAVLHGHEESGPFEVEETLDLLQDSESLMPLNWALFEVIEEEYWPHGEGGSEPESDAVASMHSQ